MSLKIVSFINQHPSDWEQLLTQKPYCLKIKRSPFAGGRYIMFNYDMIESDSYDPIVAEARGLVLDSADNFEIVRKGFNRFFNIGEGPAANIDWASAEATIKEDGTLIFLSYYDGRWIFGTRQNFDVFDAEMSSELYPTFGDLLMDVIQKKYPIFDKLLKNKDNSIFSKLDTYCFELCSRHNRIVIDYPEPKLFLLAAFDLLDGVECLDQDMYYLAQHMGVDCPEFYKMESSEDYSKLVEDFGVQHEGLVIRDKFGQRLKMKSKLYFDLHKTVSNGAMDREAIVRLVRKGEQAEFLSYFPDYAEKFAEIEQLVAEASKTISRIRHQTAQQRDEMGWSRKEFAMFHKQEKTSMLWFKAWEDKLTDDFISSISDEKYLQLFG